MKPLKIINFFDSIPKINSYSHVGNSLEKMFKMSSLKHFIKTLKFKEEFHKKYLNEKTAFKKSKEYDIYEMEGIKVNKFNEEPDIFSLPVSKTIPKNKIKNNNCNKSYFFHKKNNNNLNESPDALKYNPNYNAISKNIPSIKIVKSFFDKNKKNFNKTNILNSEVEENINKNILKDIKTKTHMNTINNADYKRKNINGLFKKRKELNDSIEGKHIKRFITEIPIKNKNFFKNKSFKKNNNRLPEINLSESPHYMQSLKSDKKQNILTESTESNNNAVSLKNNRAVDFGKMLSRSSKIFLNTHSLKVPNSGYYEPKYNLIEKRIYDIYINRPSFDKFKKKQLLLKKLMTSYNIGANYQLIDNSKLNVEALNRINI